MTKGTVPGRDKADNTSGCQAALNDRPLSADFMMARAHALTPRPNTRLQPFRFADDRNLDLHCCYLIGESIHEVLDHRLSSSPQLPGLSLENIEST